MRRPRMPEPVEPGEVLAEAAGADVVRGPRQVLHGVDLTVAAGEVVAVVGPNGAGKSTTVGLLSGDLGATAGTVTVFGRPVRRWRPADLAVRRGVLPQHTTVAFPFTVAEVVAMGRAPWAGTPLAADDEAAVAEAMAATEVTGFAERTFGTLSGGERARVALARVLAQRTPLLLLDEPTAALDLRHQDLVMRVAVAHARAGGAVLAVLHDLNLAAAHADRIAVIAGGRVAACGQPARVLTPELLTGVYQREIEVIEHPRTGAPLVLP
ncbi:heme ABC transporter ATP-binding protein [Actinophytocola xinjiangensis]|uniref:Heme ABC transporter ATP-binding protein n=1 Tax=Actinophytocola xinjiangensis TaxID=485602 RepID=A0A7Z0WJK3_9PSEU|nr:heme ABC transporter ATP-binding protein [Actinophytocola xinjiangensis]OLF08780.1 heme ABC transporter ATP-binding protein [Actinophytocola xinjiangensis]